MQHYVQKFKSYENDVVVIADKEHYDVQELLISSKLLITDYSSVFFDFAYMNKPLIYYQFDRKQFRENHYAEGYFSYENDGFGPCFEKYEDMKQYLIHMIENQCDQPEKYDLRVKDFFDLCDNHNCERTFNAIKALEEH
jgi:CDP-glycerol glycerophosphotransferase (TagB/SpsB family)